MKFIDSKYEIWEQEPSLIGVYKQIEKAARTSYKSEDRITEGSAQKMVDTLIKNGHGACLEHGTVYLTQKYDDAQCIGPKYERNPYSRVVYDTLDKLVFVTTNARVIVENDWQDDLQYYVTPTWHHYKRYTVKLYCSIGIGREVTRHRGFSFMQESTRYCNYSKGKFDNELTLVIPQWIYCAAAERASYIDSLTGEPQDYLASLSGTELINTMICKDRTVATWYETLSDIESNYNYLTTTDEGWTCKAQEARGILPLDLKSELVMTGFEEDWKHFFDLRSYKAKTGKPHPDIQILADMLLDEFRERNYIKDE